MRMHRPHYTILGIIVISLSGEASAQITPTQPASPCITGIEFDTLATKVIQVVKQYTAPADSADDAYRIGLGYALVAANQLSIVTQSTVCTKAEAAYRTATSGGQGNTGRVVVVKAGETYTVLDPGHYWSHADPRYRYVLMNNKYQVITVFGN